MNPWRKLASSRAVAVGDKGDSRRKSRWISRGTEQQNNGLTNSLDAPLESHWHLPQEEGLRKRTFRSRLSFRSLQRSLTRMSKSNTFRTMFQGVRDPKEAKLVEALRESLLSKGQLPEKHDDYHTLLRFLRMRNFDLSKAETMFVNLLKWRAEKDVDTIAKDFQFEEYEAVKKCYPHGYHGVDKYGRPLYIDRIGSIDVNALLQCTSMDRFVKYHISEQEKTLSLRFPACSLAAKRHVATTTAIVDVKQLHEAHKNALLPSDQRIKELQSPILLYFTKKDASKFSRLARDLFMEIQRIDSNYYPETLNKLFIINAGPGFKTLWKVLSVFLEARTLSKIQVLGSMYLDKISEVVDLSNLPETLGGNCKCLELGGCLSKDKGPWTDPEIVTKLMDVFEMAQKLTERSTNMEDFEDLTDFPAESSGKQRRSSTVGTIAPLIEYSQSYCGTRSMVQKINDLEAWLLGTNKILRELNDKQQALANLIDQLRNDPSILQNST